MALKKQIIIKVFNRHAFVQKLDLKENFKN